MHRAASHTIYAQERRGRETTHDDDHKQKPGHELVLDRDEEQHARTQELWKAK